MSYRDIIIRLEDAKGPDRELDWRIAETFDIPEKWVESTLWPPFMNGSPIDRKIPHYSASIDAAITLAEQMLPGMNNSVIKEGDNEFSAYIWPTSGPFTPEWKATGVKSSRSIAILLALFRALEAKELAA